MKRYGYYEYDPGLYPRRLWVAVGLRQEDLEGVFKSEKGKTVDFDLCVAEAVTCFEVRRCSDNKIGELVVFDNHATMRLVGIVSHEACLRRDRRGHRYGTRRRGQRIPDRVDCVLHQQCSFRSWRFR